MNTQLRLHRLRYVNDAVATASPARLVCMLYDRLVRDLQMAELAIVAAEPAVASENLVHAQDIVHELQASLDVTKWKGGPGLSSVYTFLHGELIQANVKKDAKRVRSCLTLVEPLADAWRQAANELLVVSAAQSA